MDDTVTGYSASTILAVNTSTNTHTRTFKIFTDMNLEVVFSWLFNMNSLSSLQNQWYVEVKAYFNFPQGRGLLPGFSVSLVPLAEWFMEAAKKQRPNRCSSFSSPARFQLIIFLHNPREICFWLEYSWGQSKNFFSCTLKCSKFVWKFCQSNSLNRGSWKSLRKLAVGSD